MNTRGSVAVGSFVGSVIGFAIGGVFGKAAVDSLGGRRDEREMGMGVAMVLGTAMGALIGAVAAAPTADATSTAGLGALPHVCPIPTTSGVPPVVSQLQQTPYQYNSTLNTYYLDPTFKWGASILYKNGFSDSVYNMPSREKAMEAIQALADAAFAKELAQG